MLQDIRKSMQGTAAKVVIGLVIATFALFGAESIVGGLGGEPEVATVNGEGVTEREFLIAVDAQRRMAFAQMGEDADPDLIDENLIRSTTLEGLIQDRVIIQDAENKDLFVSLETVNTIITSLERFQRDGQFSNDVLDAYLRNSQTTLSDFQENIRKQYIVQQVRNGLAQSSFVLKDELNDVLLLDRETRSFGLLTIDKNEYKDEIEVTDSDMLSYYEDNKEVFRRPRNVDVSYLVLDRDFLAAGYEPSEEAIESAYLAEIEDFVGEEERDASHILIKMDDDKNEEQALELVQNIATRLSSGEDFATLAKEFSEDEGSAEDGGALGASPKGVYVQEFEDALFALEEGKISEPVKTEFGYHLIKLNAIQKNAVPSLDEMRFQITQNLILEKSNEEFAELSSQLEDISYSASDLEEPSEELGLEIKQLAGVSSLTSDRYFSNPRVQKRLFNEELINEGTNSDVIEVEDGKAIVFRVNQLHESSIAPFEDVKDTVRSRVLNAKAAKKAESIGNAFIARVGAGEDPKLVSEELSLDWGKHSEIRRNNVMVNSEVVEEVFTIELSEQVSENMKGFSILDGDYSVVVLESVNRPEDAGLTDAEQRALSGMLSSGIGGGEYEAYRQEMVSSAVIERI